MLVGDIIIAIREAITDMPPTLPTPAAPAVSVITPASSTLAAGTYFLQITQRNAFGETLPATESAQQTVGAGQGIQIASPLLPGATTIRAYLTLVNGLAGSECCFVESTITPFTIIANPSNPGNIPTRNTAYNPDADGDSFSCATLYRWLNDALKKASQIGGGLIDYSGVGTVSGVPMYTIPGQWIVIPDVWYDGYPLAPDKVGNFFRRNSITASVLSSVTTSLLTDRMNLEVWPQPSRTAASTTLSSPLAANGITAACVNIGGFLLTNGFCQIGTEICAYSQISGGALNNLMRGLSGTSPASAWPAGTVVNELNLFFHGWRRYAPTFQPGQSLSSVPVPVGWETILPIYGLARVKLAEQDADGYAKLNESFTGEMKAYFKQNRITTGPKQIGESSNTLEVMPSMGGGWVIP